MRPRYPLVIVDGEDWCACRRDFDAAGILSIDALAPGDSAQWFGIAHLRRSRGAGCVRRDAGDWPAPIPRDVSDFTVEGRRIR